MTMPPWLRKLALAIHITASVGWLGAVAAFLALAITGLNGQDAFLVSGAYLAMDVTVTYVIVPLSIASLVSGLIQSLGTSWGLFRHYWVIAKLLITAVSTFLLLSHTQGVRYVAEVSRSRDAPRQHRSPFLMGAAGDRGRWSDRGPARDHSALGVQASWAHALRVAQTILDPMNSTRGLPR